MKFKGRVWKFGNNIDTDVILPAKYCNTIDPKELAIHCMEGIFPEFSKKINKGDIIVGEENFGCGSSREVAPLSIKSAGISCVIAKSFGRIFFRNAINIGLPIFETEEIKKLENHHIIEVNGEKGKIINLTTGEEIKIKPMPNFIRQIIEKGGLLAYIKERDTQKV
jgi:3-isopropylmalate dehydratase small subunit